jgi:hypothetical protein
MRIGTIVGVFLFALLVPAGARAEPSLYALHIAGAMLSFEQLSADGCRHTTGQVGAAVSLELPGTSSTRVLVVGLEQDLCSGQSRHFYGSKEGGAFVLGLLFGKAHATLLAGDEAHPVPIAVELDVSWVGTGAIQGACQESDAPEYTEVTCNFQRAGAASGVLRVGGQAAAVTGVQLLQRTVVRLPGQLPPVS